MSNHVTFNETNGSHQATSPCPAGHSTVAASFLLENVLGEYDRGITACRLFRRGLNDLYLARGRADEQYILKLHQLDFRSESELLFMCDVLEHLDREGCRVSVPLRKKDGTLLSAVNAPEGRRYAVLYPFVAGGTAKPSMRNLRLYGETLGKIHAGTRTFESEQPGARLDLGWLIEQPLEDIKRLRRIVESTGQRVGRQQKEAVEYLFKTAGEIKAHVQEALPADSPPGDICHGDYHPYNLMMENPREATCIDFDYCGWGWANYDIATLIWPYVYNKYIQYYRIIPGGRGGLLLSAKNIIIPRTLRKGYRKVSERLLEGYTSQLPCAHAELIPHFFAIRHIWWLGFRATEADIEGLQGRSDASLAIELLKIFVSECM